MKILKLIIRFIKNVLFYILILGILVGISYLGFKLISFFIGLAIFHFLVKIAFFLIGIIVLGICLTFILLLKFGNKSNGGYKKI